MEQFVFPAVLYKDAENRGYTIILSDVNICTEGVSVEDAFLRAKERPAGTFSQRSLYLFLVVGSAFSRLDFSSSSEFVKILYRSKERS